MTRYIIIEGPDATGTSTHADALAGALRARGIDAAAYHHPRHPSGAVGLARVRHYVAARDALVEAPPAAVVVMDRGPLSGYVHAWVWESAVYGDAELLAASEWKSRPWCEAPVVVLDAPDDVLDARLVARGEDPREAHAERLAWRAVARELDMRTVDTARDVGTVRAELLAWALDAIGGAT